MHFLLQKQTFIYIMINKIELIINDKKILWARKNLNS